jgi:WD40 repeat protein
MDLHRVDAFGHSSLICKTEFDEDVDRARSCIILSDHADRAATGHYNGFVRIWRRSIEAVPNESWQQTMNFNAHNQVIYGLSLLISNQSHSETGPLVSCSASDKIAKVWTMNDDKSSLRDQTFEPLSHQSGVVSCTRLRPVGDNIESGVFCCCLDGTVYRWTRTVNGAWNQPQHFGPMGSCRSIALPADADSLFSSVCETVATVGSNRVTLWKCRDSTYERAAIVQHGRRGRVIIRGCSVRNDGQMIAVCDSEGTIRLWCHDTKSGTESKGWRCLHIEVASYGEDIWSCAFGRDRMAGTLFYALQGPKGSTLKMLDTHTFIPSEGFTSEKMTSAVEDVTFNHEQMASDQLESERSPSPAACRHASDKFESRCSYAVITAACAFRGVNRVNVLVDKMETSGAGPDWQASGAGQWEACIFVGGERRVAGRFDSAEEAADAWDTAMLATFDPQVCAPIRHRSV